MSLQKDWGSSRVFVTGATGLLGSHLVELLLERGAHVTVLIRDHIAGSRFEEFWHKTNRVNGDIENLHLLERVLNEYEIDTVFHLAAQTIVGIANESPLSTFNANIKGTWNILEACRWHSKRIKKVVIASSDKAYGNLNGASYDETMPLHGDHPYDVSKSCADLIAQSYYKTYRTPVLITRFGNLFGEGDLNFNRLIPGTIQSILERKPIVIRSNGKLIRDYIYVKDAALAYLKLAESEIVGEAFNFSYGLRFPVTQVVDDICGLMNHAMHPIQILNEASLEIPIQTLNSQKAKDCLNWMPSYGWAQGLKNTIHWYKFQSDLKAASQ